MLHEWGLGGRRFGTVITWFLVGGDLYTAYTFIAVPALAFGAGAIAFFAVPYTILIYPILFLVFPRLWHVCHKHNYITPADFVRGRFGNRWLALAVAVTGIVATMPYIALQLVGLQVVIAAHGRFRHRLYRRSAAGHRLHHSRRLHLFQRAARAGLDRHRQGHPDLHHRVRRRHRRADPAWRLRQDLCRGAAGEIAAGGARRQHHRRLRLLRDAGARLGARAVPLSAFDHRDLEREQRPRHPPQRGAAAGLFVHARAAGAGRLFRHRRRRRAAFPNSRRASSSSAPISRCRRCSCTASRPGSSASLLPRSASARWCRRRSCRSPRPISIPATSIASSSTPIRPTSRKRRWRNGCR